MQARLIALIGRQDQPTDGVADYCKFLGEALERRGVGLETDRVAWHDLGWIAALRKLERQSAQWRGSWVVVHYTALSWSRRGFPLGILLVLRRMRRSGMRCAILFHESGRQLSGTRWRDKFRGAVQEWAIRRCYRAADKAIFTIPLENVRWLPRERAKASYIPIGANIPERILPESVRERKSGEAKTVVVFCMSAGENRRREIEDMAHAAERVRELGEPVRFVVLGKGSAEARPEMEAAFRNKGVELSVLGRLPANQVADTLAGADVLLYLGAYVTQTRGSALAGIACGLPIVGYSGKTHEPIHDAGVEMAPYRDSHLLACALVRVLRDDSLRIELQRKSVIAQRHFSWEAISAAFVRILNLEQVDA